MSVKGSDAESTIVDGQHSGTVFTIGSPTNNDLDVMISGMKITNGNVGGVVSYGGGILNQARLKVDGCTISGNRAYQGGGIYSGGINPSSLETTIEITDSIITGNTARDGAGIQNYIRGTATIEDSTISGNSADMWGGGIYQRGIATITGSTIADNNAVGGGGIYNNWLLSETTITDSVITGNTASFGGGIALADIPGTVIIKGSTITGNSYGGISNDGGTVEFIDSNGNTINWPDWDPTQLYGNNPAP